MAAAVAESGVEQTVRSVTSRLLEENAFFGSFDSPENFRAVATPVLRCCGLPGPQVVGFVEDTFLLMNCMRLNALPLDADLRANESCIMTVLNMDVDAALAACGEEGPAQYIKNLCNEKLLSLSSKITNLQITFTALQFFYCWKLSQELDAEDAAAKMIKRNLDNFGRQEMSQIFSFLQSPAAATVLGRQPENAGAPMIQQFLDTAKEKLGEIEKDIEEAQCRTRSIRNRLIASAILSMTNLAYSAFRIRETWHIATGGQRFLLASSTGLDTLACGWSIDRAVAAGVQLQQLQGLKETVSRYLAAVDDAEYAFRLEDDMRPSN